MALFRSFIVALVALFSTLAGAQSLTMTGTSGIVPAVDASFVGTFSQAFAGTTTPSATGVSFGAASSDRYIFVGFTARIASGTVGNVSNPSIGGVSGQAFYVAAGNTTSGWLWAFVPSGTSGTIAITTVGNSDSLSGVVYAVKNVRMPAAITGAAVNQGTAGTTWSLSSFATEPDAAQLYYLRSSTTTYTNNFTSPTAGFVCPTGNAAECIAAVQMSTSTTSLAASGTKASGTAVQAIGISVR
jgi:hypothetical protein